MVVHLEAMVWKRLSSLDCKYDPMVTVLEMDCIGLIHKNGSAYKVYCLMDSTYDGGGWTLVSVHSDDGQMHGHGTTDIILIRTQQHLVH